MPQCHHQTSLTACTLFENTKLAMTTWYFGDLFADTAQDAVRPTKSRLAAQTTGDKQLMAIQLRRVKGFRKTSLARYAQTLAALWQKGVVGRPVVFYYDR